MKVSEVDNYNHWEQLYAANPDAAALVGLCAPDVASLGKLNAANGDKFVAGGYDMTPQNLKAIKDGHAYVTLGQSAFVQGYLPVALLVNAIKTKTALAPGFFNAGTQVVTAKSVDMGNGLPPVTFEQAQALAADPAATAKYYKPWIEFARRRRAHGLDEADRRRVRVIWSRRSSSGGDLDRLPATTMAADADPRRAQSRQALRRRHRARRHESAGRTRRHPRRRRRKRRRQIDADESAGGRRSGRTAAPSKSTAPKLRSIRPSAARKLGIGIVYQELSLFPQRSVLANLFVNREPTRFGFVSRRAMEERSRDLLDRLGLKVDVRAPVGLLSIGEQQLVELCRVLLEEPRLLILDEPNSALNKRRDRATVRGPAPTARARHHDALCFAPSRRGVRHFRRRDDYAQRPRRADEGSRAL